MESCLTLVDRMKWLVIHGTVPDTTASNVVGSEDGGCCYPHVQAFDGELFMQNTVLVSCDSKTLSYFVANVHNQHCELDYVASKGTNLEPPAAGTTWATNNCLDNVYNNCTRRHRSRYFMRTSINWPPDPVLLRCTGTRFFPCTTWHRVVCTLQILSTKQLIGIWFRTRQCLERPCR